MNGYGKEYVFLIAVRRQEKEGRVKTPATLINSDDADFIFRVHKVGENEHEARRAVLQQALRRGWWMSAMCLESEEET